MMGPNSIKLVQRDHCQCDVTLVNYVGPPILQEGSTFRIVENSLNIPIDLSQDPAAFPEPTSYTWTRNGGQLSSPPYMLTYSTVTFSSVSRNDAGNYMVSATNFVLDNDTLQVGSDTGAFILDVICKTNMNY